MYYLFYFNVILNLYIKDSLLLNVFYDALKYLFVSIGI